MKRCPQCGREYPEDYQFCQQDATELVAQTNNANRSALVAFAVLRPWQWTVWLIAGIVVVVLAGGWKIFAGSAQTDRNEAIVPDLPRKEISSHPSAQAAPASPDPSGPVGDNQGTSSPTTDPEPDGAWKLYTNAELNIQLYYPSSWTVQVTHYSDRVRVQFSGPGDVSAGLDVSPSSYQSMAEWERKHPGTWIWGDQEAGFLKRKGVHYHRERIGSYSLGDQIATSWEFTVQPEGKPTVRKWDVGTICNRKGYALICEAPNGQFSESYPKFDHMITTMKFRN